MNLKFAIFLNLIFVLPVLAETKLKPGIIWDMKSLSRTPETFTPPEIFSKEYLKVMESRNIRPVWFEGEPFKGQQTRIFAWVGFPKHSEKAKPASIPAMVLVHGGGGTANPHWVYHWIQRGYAAIAMDTCGYLPVKGPEHIKNKKGRVLNLRTEYSGPKPYGFKQLNRPLKDQWAYHAVSSVILSNSLLRSYPQIDPENIGIIGVSWGGYLTCLTAGTDQRFKCAISVYGCGFIHEDSVWADNELKKLSSYKRKLWAKHWDPSSTLPNATMPMLWVTGTNDFAYVLGSLQKSYKLVKEPVTLSVKVRMHHGHAGGWEPKENYVFASSLLKGTTPLAEITDQKQLDKTVTVSYSSKSPITKAELVFTKDTGKWQKRYWQKTLAKLDKTNKQVTAKIPDGTSTYFVNIIDARKCVVSSQHVEVNSK